MSEVKKLLYKLHPEVKRIEDSDLPEDTKKFLTKMEINCNYKAYAPNYIINFDYISKMTNEEVEEDKKRLMNEMTEMLTELRKKYKL
jgi:hypothetical protein